MSICCVSFYFYACQFCFYAWHSCFLFLFYFRIHFFFFFNSSLFLFIYLIFYPLFSLAVQIHYFYSYSPFSFIFIYPLSSLTIQIDPRGEGDWLDCVSLPDIGLPKGWAKESFIGLTAATGQLSGEWKNILWGAFFGTCIWYNLF